MVNVIAEAFTTTFWKWLIIDVLGFIQNYGWRVIFLTMAIKLILAPLDFFNRKKSIDNARKMEKMKPELDKISKQYANNPAELQKKRSALYKKYGYGVFSSCIAMLIPLIIFITLISGYTGTSKVLNTNRYNHLKEIYTQNVAQYKQDVTEAKVAEVNAINQEWYDYQVSLLSGTKDKTEEEIVKMLEEKLGFVGIKKGNNVFTIDNIKSQPQQRQYDEVVKYIAQLRVYDEYEAHGKDSFLWIKNIWRADTWANPIPTQSEFYSLTGIKENADVDYNDVMGIIQYRYKGQWNGLLILVVLSVGLNVLNTWMSMRQQKANEDPTNGAMGSMKIMMFMMPILIGYFALSQTSAFTLYMAVNSFMTLIINLISTGILKLIDKNNKEEESPYARRIIR
ncbi:MAG TPA: YidC/Oxa1 family membrane protein insertase [Clostridia bacterium]